ncbi:MAG TPA: hypothetical protein VNI01_00315 [Elusimicrobiota bacterium]|jgi:type II secretory pathway pseudopilin PulG|nr:hypothetical protein [Elusimicrobiota bacterium]
MKGRKGFSLIEVGIAVVALAVVAKLSYPTFLDMLRRSRERDGKMNLGAIRSALSIYYDDVKAYPADASLLTQRQQYLLSMPPARTPNYHPDDNKIVNAASANDRGGWVYQGDAAAADFGKVFVNCTHTDSKGNVWASY